MATEYIIKEIAPYSSVGRHGIVVSRLNPKCIKTVLFQQQENISEIILTACEVETMKMWHCSELNNKSLEQLNVGDIVYIISSIVSQP